MAQIENTQNLYKEVDIRKNKIKVLKESGINPYAPKFEQTHSISEARKCKLKTPVKTGGRIVARRIFGKFMFIQIADVYDKIQVSVNVADVGEKKYKFIIAYVRDFVNQKSPILENRAFHIYKISKPIAPSTITKPKLNAVNLARYEPALPGLCTQYSRKVISDASEAINVPAPPMLTPSKRAG